MGQILQPKQDDNPEGIQANLSEHVRELQRKLDELADLVVPPEPAAAPEVPLGTRQFIRKILRLRANRRSIFGAGLFGEPSWDMLLELYDAHFTGRSESVSSLCFASGVPATTALRWINALERAGQIKKTADPKDGRRYFIELTEEGKAGMDRVFSAIHLHLLPQSE